MYAIRVTKADMRYLRNRHREIFTQKEDGKRVKLKSYFPFKSWVRSLNADPLTEFSGKALKIRQGGKGQK